MSDDLKRVALEACVLIAFGGLFGLTLNHQLVLDAFSGRVAAAPRPAAGEPPAAALPMPALLEDVRQALAGGGVIVDARDTELYVAGHIEGAVSLPLAEFERLLPAFRDSVPKERAVIVYCSGFGCPDSFDLGVLLIGAGYPDVRVFEGGFPEWRDAGLPVAGEGR